MKIAIPVANEQFQSFENGGHAPLFAILEKIESGAWSSLRFIEFRNNPKANPASPGRCNHDENEPCGNHDNHDHEGDPHHDEESADKHGALAQAVLDCDIFIAQWACGKTRAALKKRGVTFHLLSEDTPVVKLAQDFLQRESGHAVRNSTANG